MIIKFKHLIIENFLSFGYAELDLNDLGYTLINGVNNNPNDNAISNGSGKSATWDALCYAITGETIRGISKNLINIHTTGGMRVELIFDIDNNSYRIIRTKDHKEYGTTVKFYINGEDKSGKGVRDTEKIISECLPEITSNLIGSVIILGQGMPQKFTSNTPSGRKEILEKLSNSDFMIEDIKNRLNNRKISLNKQSKELDISIASSQGQLKIYEQNLENYKNQLKNLVPPDINEINNVQDKINKLKADIDSLNNNLNELRDKLTIANQALLDLNWAQSEEINNSTSQLNTSLMELQSKKAEINANINSLLKEITRLDSIKDICPTCGQKLPNVHKVDTSDKKKELKNLQLALDSVINNIKSLEEEKIANTSSITKKYETLKLEATNNVNNIKLNISNKSKELDNINNELNHQTLKLLNLQNNQANYEHNKNELQNNISNVETNITQIKDKILYGTLNKENVDNRLDIVTKMFSIATRDFRGFLLSNIISYIDKRAKIYSQDIFNTDKIEFSLDGNNLNISYDNKNYENLSGGEKRRVDIISQLSLRDMLCQFNNFSSNILVLDEITENLDEHSTTAVFNCIAKKLTDVESVFIITHKTDISSIPTDSVITIIKDENGVSRIENAI